MIHPSIDQPTVNHAPSLPISWFVMIIFLFNIYFVGFFPSITSSFGTKNNQTKLSSLTADMGMDQYLLIPFLMG
jgi:hypothetical protein